VNIWITYYCHQISYKKCWVLHVLYVGGFRTEIISAYDFCFCLYGVMLSRVDLFLEFLGCVYIV